MNKIIEKIYSDIWYLKTYAWTNFKDNIDFRIIRFKIKNKIKILNLLKKLHLYKFRCCICHKIIERYYSYPMYNSCFHCFVDVLHPR